MKNKSLNKRSMIIYIAFLMGASNLFMVTSIPAKIETLPYQDITYENTVLEVEIISGFQAIITNIGNSDAINVEWNMKFQAPFLITFPKKISGEMELLEAESSITVPQDPNIKLFGFGSLIQSISVSAINSNTDTDSEIIGFVLGPYIIIS